MNTVSTRAVLTFLGDCKNKSSFSVPRANVNLTPSMAQQGMIRLLESGALQLSNHVGRAVDLHSAKLVQTTRTQIV